ncbi:Pyrroline-5-carboxylate reductase [Roseibaca ekhonensis]|jgi:pyrroline-5-carboxylate reductase|uniref:Pyrroline-5-carboxylate reductase n=1 Tax=Roseinatronobacter ekhonensis TaxID=254356 RepID=A0A3B0MBV7_9RHOB|nr:pyrroline-5-carboxylate reductase [Roseibaca ekhonensis]SUZ33143.1 Pyrroline-5-carboxylate reductase [Roseibaca ekhonensis]
MHDINARGIVLLGCGKMGSAMLAGWLAQGIEPGAVHVIDPNPSDWLRSTGVQLNVGLPPAPAVAVLAVKPQMMGAALPQLAALGEGETLFVSIAAGTTLATLGTALGEGSPIIRAMPNTPAAVGAGISGIIGNAQVGPTHLEQAERLLSAVGEVVTLDDESQMDAVTGLSGSGPAYVFHMIEAMAQAGMAQGLSADLAMQLARATVVGAARLADDSPDSAATLRENVTSPNGTTAAALAVLMDDTNGLPPLMVRAIAAAADRSRELAQ